MRFILFAVFVTAASMLSFAQEGSTTTVPPPTDAFLANRIPLNSRVYIAAFKSEDAAKPIEGFESYMAAAIRKKGVPVILVTDRSQADFEIAGPQTKKVQASPKSGSWATSVVRRRPH